jgi:glyoxylase-like metal-dependent hydrolase (beta-lactamase superfamily II)
MFLVCALATFALWPSVRPAAAQAPQGPQIEVTRITDNVYTFRNQNSLSMFIVTSEGVIVTDPVGYGRPQGGAQYLAEIRKLTQAPIRYLVYSHHHYDHIAGGQVFKEAGARVVAHRRALERLRPLNEPHTVLPDETFDTNRTIRLGGVELELTYIGPNHSDSAIVMRLPRERIVYVVDLVPVGQIPGRGMIDFYPMEAEQSLRRIAAMDWDRLIPGHPGVNNRLGTKQDVQDQLTFLQDASAAVRAEAREGRCWEPVESTLKLPKYASWGGYEANLQFVLRRYCALWGRGF